MEETVKDEAVVGWQPGTVAGHTPTRVGSISSIGAALHNLIHPLTRGKDAVEATHETERARGREPGLCPSRSSMDAGITGGFSLLMDSQHARRGL